MSTDESLASSASFSDGTEEVSVSGAAEVVQAESVSQPAEPAVLEMDAAAATPALSPGWYPDPASGLSRWWDGQRWTERFQQAPQAQQTPNIVIHNASNSSAQASAAAAVLGEKKPFRHGLHILLTLLTGGLWLFAYIPMYMSWKNR